MRRSCFQTIAWVSKTPQKKSRCYYYFNLFLRGYYLQKSWVWPEINHERSQTDFLTKLCLRLHIFLKFLWLRTLFQISNIEKESKTWICIDIIKNMIHYIISSKALITSSVLPPLISPSTKCLPKTVNILKRTFKGSFSKCLLEHF